METLAKSLERQEGVRREVAGGHLAVRLLVAARQALALETPDQEVDAGAAVLADSRGAASGAGGELAVLACRQTGEGTLRLVPAADTAAKHTHDEQLGIHHFQYHHLHGADISMTPPLPWCRLRCV